MGLYKIAIFAGYFFRQFFGDFCIFEKPLWVTGGPPLHFATPCFDMLGVLVLKFGCFFKYFAILAFLNKIEYKKNFKTISIFSSNCKLKIKNQSNFLFWPFPTKYTP